MGWNAELDIPAAIAGLPADRHAADHVLISMLDSTPRVSTLPSLIPLLADHGLWHEAVGLDVVIGFATLVALISDHQMLSGFDEIWLCSEIPAADKPEHLRITSDRPLASEPPAGLAEWMLASSCHSGFGDGDGLNFVTLDSGIAASCRRHSSCR
jgi:hypothetical protein